MSPDEAITAVKQAANALYALGRSDNPIGAEERQKMRQLSDKLDQVTRALGGNPMTPAWGIPGNPRKEITVCSTHGYLLPCGVCAGSRHLQTLPIRGGQEIDDKA